MPRRSLHGHLAQNGEFVSAIFVTHLAMILPQVNVEHSPTLLRQLRVTDSPRAGMEQVVREMQAAWALRAAGDDDGVFVAEASMRP
jgi:hypothetical protein